MWVKVGDWRELSRGSVNSICIGFSRLQGWVNFPIDYYARRVIEMDSNLQLRLPLGKSGGRLKKQKENKR